MSFRRQPGHRNGGLPDVAVREVPPTDGLCVVDIYNFPEDLVFADQLMKQYIVWGIAQHVADSEEYRRERGRGDSGANLDA